MVFAFYLYVNAQRTDLRTTSFLSCSKLVGKGVLARYLPPFTTRFCTQMRRWSTAMVYTCRQSLNSRMVVLYAPRSLTSLSLLLRTAQAASWNQWLTNTPSIRLSRRNYLPSHVQPTWNTMRTWSRSRSTRLPRICLRRQWRRKISLLVSKTSLRIWSLSNLWISDSYLSNSKVRILK